MFQHWLCLQSPSFALLVCLVLWYWWGHSVPADRCISRVHPAEDTWNVFLCFCATRQLRNTVLQSLLAPLVQAGSGEPAGALTLSRGIDCGMVLEHSSRSLLPLAREKEFSRRLTCIYWPLRVVDLSGALPQNSISESKETQGHSSSSEPVYLIFTSQVLSSLTVTLTVA